MAREIPLTRGAFALVDDEDYERLVSIGKWHLSDTGYAVWRGLTNGKKKTIRMHRLISDTPEGFVTDHINRNKLDNRKSNLRVCSQKDNMQNTQRMEDAKYFYFDTTKNRWAVDARSFGVRSVYVDSPQAAEKYVEALKNGRKPQRAFTKRKPLSGAKLTEKDREAIKKMFSSGMRRYEIANEMGVSPSAVGRLLAGITWR